jgi:hypothetical protein
MLTAIGITYVLAVILRYGMRLQDNKKPTIKLIGDLIAYTAWFSVVASISLAILSLIKGKFL